MMSCDRIKGRFDEEKTDFPPLRLIQSLLSLSLSLSHLLLVNGDALEGLLDDPTAVHLQRELLDVSSELKTRVKKGFMFHRSLS